ncbi:hypothetical protein Tco_0540858 [Tanacetum coccineum]
MTKATKYAEPNHHLQQFRPLNENAGACSAFMNVTIRKMFSGKGFTALNFDEIPHIRHIMNQVSLPLNPPLQIILVVCQNCIYRPQSSISACGLLVAKHGKRVQIIVTLKEDAAGNEVAHLSQPFMSQNKIGRSSTKGIEKVMPAHELLMINKHVAELPNAMLVHLQNTKDVDVLKFKVRLFGVMGSCQYGFLSGDLLGDFVFENGPHVATDDDVIIEEPFLRSSAKLNLSSSSNLLPSCALVKKNMISEFAEALTPL